MCTSVKTQMGNFWEHLQIWETIFKVICVAVVVVVEAGENIPRCKQPKKRKFVSFQSDVISFQNTFGSRWVRVSETRLGDLLDFGQPTFLSDFCKGVKIFNFSSEIIFGQLFWTFGNFLLVTLVSIVVLKDTNLQRLIFALTEAEEQ